MKAKLNHLSITLPPEAAHQLQNLLCTGSALAAHAQRYARSEVIRHEIASTWHQQLAEVKPWLSEKASAVD